MEIVSFVLEAFTFCVITIVWSRDNLLELIGEFRKYERVRKVQSND